MAKDFVLGIDLQIQQVLGLAKVRQELSKVAGTSTGPTAGPAQAAKGVDQLTQSITAAAQANAALTQSTANASAGLGTYASRSATAGAVTGKTAAAMTTGGKAANNFGNQIFLAGKRYAAFVSATAVAFKGVQGIRDATNFVLEFESAMTRLDQIMDAGSARIAQLEQQFLRLSQATGTSATEIAENARILAQAGFQGAELDEALEQIAKVPLLPAFESSTQATTGLIAIMRQFKEEGKSTAEIFDVLNEVANNYSVTSQGIIEGVKRSGAAFAAFGGSLEDFIRLPGQLGEARAELGGELVQTGDVDVELLVGGELQAARLPDAGLQVGHGPLERLGLFEVGLDRPVRALRDGLRYALLGLRSPAGLLDQLLQQRRDFRASAPVLTDSLAQFLEGLVEQLRPRGGLLLPWRARGQTQRSGELLRCGNEMPGLFRRRAGRAGWDGTGRSGRGTKHARVGCSADRWCYPEFAHELAEVEHGVLEPADRAAEYVVDLVLASGGGFELLDGLKLQLVVLLDVPVVLVGYPEEFYAPPVESGGIWEPPIGEGQQYRDVLHGEHQGEQWWDWKIEYHLPDAEPPTWSGSLEEGYNHATFPQLMSEMDRIGYQKSTTTAVRYKRQKYNGLAYAAATSGVLTFSYCGVNMNTAGQFTNDTDDDLDIVVEGRSSITVTVPPQYPPETPEDPWPDHLVPLIFDYRLRAEFNVYVSGTLAHESHNSLHDYGGGEGTDPGREVTCEHSDSYTITVPANSAVEFSVNARAEQDLFTGFWTVIGLKPHTGLPLPSTQSAEVSFWGRNVSFSRSYQGQTQNYGWADNTGQIPPPG